MKERGEKTHVNVWSSRPSKEEEPNRGSEDGTQGRHQSVLLSAKTMCHNVGHKVEIQIGHIRQEPEDTCDQDAEEGDTDLTQVEAVIDRVDKWEDLEETVVDTVHDGAVYVDESNGGIFDSDFQGFDERVDGNCGRLEPLLVNLRLRLETRIVCEFAETLCSTEKDVGSRGLGRAEHHKNEYGAGDPDDFPQ